ncbi:MAG: leucyl aminopeptidase [Nitrospinaceae bacterium]
MIKTTAKHDDPFRHPTDCLTLFCVEEKGPSGLLKEIDRSLHGIIAASYKDKRFEAKSNQVLLLNARGMLKAENVLLAGVGKQKEITEDRLRQAAGTAAKQAEKSRFSKLSFFLEDGAFEKMAGSRKKGTRVNPAQAVTEGAQLALYHFDPYKSKENESPPHRVREIVLFGPSKTQAGPLRKGVGRGVKVAEAVWLTRDLISHPSNRATPGFLAATARKIARNHALTCKILGTKEMKKLGMGSLLGVARGSHEPPAFIILEYFGAGKKEAPVVIVGKGVTFDTGGISLKPSANMDEMKMDMSGGAVTLGTLQAAASLQLPVNVVGLVPATENMPGGSAIKPGDILTSMSGKTIEVLNTDAEGRLVLADALNYAARYKPRAVIDLATLTGAVVVALGHLASAVLGNNEPLIATLKECGDATGERVWHLPLWEEHEKAVKSDIADLKNIAAPGVGAGTITGAAFLKAFAGDQPWTHIDIAGTSWSSEEKPYIPKGPSGYGVRLLIHFLEQTAASGIKK